MVRPINSPLAQLATAEISVAVTAQIAGSNSILCSQHDIGWPHRNRRPAISYYPTYTARNYHQICQSKNYLNRREEATGETSRLGDHEFENHDNDQV
ncbi:unnamed protein product [Thelazia callipaeda]|uniref:Secreted protein n=1 Tax=Thelazia callipaeda TaxID=103827 RepID=A0A0N5CPD3_THECL|nr:unnamed protein product [Thelazia callipaeda]